MPANRLAVIATTWRRLQRLAPTIEGLLNQTFKDYDLFVWNNNREPGQPEIVNAACCQYLDRLPITTIHAYENMGCRGRQFLARRLGLKFGYRYVVFLDDDLRLMPGMLGRLWEEKQPTTIVSPNVWKASSSLIWPKEDARPGEYGFYGQSCGAIIDTSLFANNQYWSMWPKRYWPVDDLWMCMMASALGWRIIKSSFSLIQDPCASDANARADDPHFKTLWKEFAGLHYSPQPGRFGMKVYEGILP